MTPCSGAHARPAFNRCNAGEGGDATRPRIPSFFLPFFSPLPLPKVPAAPWYRSRSSHLRPPFPRTARAARDLISEAEFRFSHGARGARAHIIPGASLATTASRLAPHDPEPRAASHEPRPRRQRGSREPFVNTGRLRHAHYLGELLSAVCVCLRLQAGCTSIPTKGAPTMGLHGRHYTPPREVQATWRKRVGKWEFDSK